MSRPSGASGCTPERAELLRWAAGLGAVTADALAVHDSCGIASARGRLAAAERRGLLSAWRVLSAQPTLFTVTRAGMRAASLAGLEPSRVSAGTAAHAVACCLVAAKLERAFSEHDVLGEPGLRREQRLRGGSFVSVTMSGLGSAAQARHRPDLALLGRPPGASRPVAVEVELTVKSPRRLQSICRAWARSREVEGVLYVVAPDVRGPLRRAIDATAAGSRVVAVDLEAL